MEEISITEEPYFDVDCTHLKSFDADLYRQLICYPQVTYLLSRNSNNNNTVRSRHHKVLIGLFIRRAWQVLAQSDKIFAA